MRLHLLRVTIHLTCIVSWRSDVRIAVRPGFVIEHAGFFRYGTRWRMWLEQIGHIHLPPSTGYACLKVYQLLTKGQGFPMVTLVLSSCIADRYDIYFLFVHPFRRIHFYLYICVILCFQLQRHVDGASPTSAVYVEPAADPADTRTWDLSISRPALYRLSYRTPQCRYDINLDIWSRFTPKQSSPMRNFHSEWPSKFTPHIGIRMWYIVWVVILYSFIKHVQEICHV